MCAIPLVFQKANLSVLVLVFLSGRSVNSLYEVIEGGIADEESLSGTAGRISALASAISSFHRNFVMPPQSSFAVVMFSEAL